MLVLHVLCLGLVGAHLAAAAVHQSIQDARRAHQQLVQRYIKTLNKEEGAIRLVGGDAEYEGRSWLCFHTP